MHFKDGLTTNDVRLVYADLSVEASGTQQSGVEYIGAVGSRQDDYAGVGAEAVHFY